LSQRAQPERGSAHGAELYGLIAYLYGQTEADLAHILSIFSLVAEPEKIAALNAYRDVAKGDEVKLQSVRVRNFKAIFDSKYGAGTTAIELIRSRCP
jgi:hypothetical protein